MLVPNNLLTFIGKVFAAVHMLFLRAFLREMIGKYKRRFQHIVVISDREIMSTRKGRFKECFFYLQNNIGALPADAFVIVIFSAFGDRQGFNSVQNILQHHEGIAVLPSQFISVALHKTQQIETSDLWQKANDYTYTSDRGLFTVCSNIFDTALQISPVLTAAFLTIHFALLSFAGGFAPKDDLARHLKAYQYGYDYSKLFVYSFHPTYNIYWLFDHLASALYLSVGHCAATILQLIPLAITLFALFRMTKGQNKNVVSMSVILLFAFVWHRYVLARPSILVSSIFLLAHSYRNELPRFIHFLIGTLLGSLYYLFFLYTIPFALNKRIASAYIAASAASLVGWYLYSKGAYFSDIASLLHTVNVIPKSKGPYFTEMRPVLAPSIFLFGAVLIPFIARAHKDFQRSLATAWFIFLNQLRYMETAVPLMLTYLGLYIKKIPAYYVVAGVTMLFALAGPYNYDTVKLPAGSVIFTRDTQDMNAIVTASDYVKVVPSANLGWNDPQLKNAAVAMGQEGTLDCSIFDKYHFDYVVEKTLKSPPSCLAFNGMQGAYRIWTPLLKH